MIQYGFESNLWMAKAVIAGAHPTLVKKAIAELIDFIAGTTEDFTGEEILDRLVQVSATGTYTPPEDIHGIVEDAIRMADDILSDDHEDQIRKFRDVLNGMIETEDPEPDYGAIMNDLGLPEDDLNDLLDNDDEDD